MEDLRVREDLVIPVAELLVASSRASGPGGQHVNKTSTRITLRWSILESAILTEGQRTRLLTRLDARLTRGGVLVVHAGDTPSQSRNRQLARQRLVALVREALAQARRRRPTRPSRASVRRRLDAKKRRGALKRTRRIEAGD